jgi:sugar (pentulose or hexulose) kinase
LHSRRIAGLAVDGTSGTILLTNSSGDALTSGVMYDDLRAGEEAHSVSEAGEAIWAALGYPMQPSWALPKLLWLLREHGNSASGARLTHQADFINRRFAGCEVPSDSSNALKTGYDLLNESWPYHVLEALGIPEQIMPEVVRPGTRIGTVCADAAAATGIPAGTPIIAGMTDGCAAQIGAGALDAGSWNVVLGTTLVLKGVTNHLIRDPGGALYSHRSPDGCWLPGGASNCGAGVFTNRFPGQDLDILGSHAAEQEPVDIIAYPLAVRGERFPFVAPAAEGFVLGDTPSDICLYAALLQGVSFVERLCFDYLDMLGAPVGGSVTLTGGGARIRYWCQLCADVLERPVQLPENAEPAFGMAVLAASRGRTVRETAKQMVHIREVIEPRAGRLARLRELYLRLIEELARRGWLQTGMLRHAKRRAQLASA